MAKKTTSNRSDSVRKASNKKASSKAKNTRKQNSSQGSGISDSLVLENNNTMTKEELQSQYNVLPKEFKDKFDKNKGNLDKFAKKLLKKFDTYIQSVLALPDRKDENGNLDTSKINTMVLVDDYDSKKMSKPELKDKLSKIASDIATEVDKKISPEVVLVSEVWQSCYDQKMDLVNTLSVSAPVYDKGIASGFKIADVHRRMVIKKFEKYIVSYCIMGAFTKGRITQQSDIDVFVVIDDTDVKKMTRAELKDKLRSIIVSMGYEAKQMTGVNREFHVQVYILTDFWDSLKEAHPVILDMVKDGVPLYDRGIFMPWKQLLLMGKIRPSDEAIEMFMSSGEQIQGRIKHKLREIAMEDIFLSIQTPSQAALMTYGLPPPAPKETPKMMEDIFVKKEKMLEKKYIDILTEVIKTRKDIEHGAIKEIQGSKIDELLSKSKDYLERIKKLFKEIDSSKTISSMNDLYDKAISSVRDVLVYEGAEEVPDENISKEFKRSVIDKGSLPQSVYTTFKEILKAKADFDKGKLSSNDVSKIKKKYNRFIKDVVEYLQRKRAKDINSSKIRVKHGDKIGEALVLGKKVYIIHDLEADEREVSSANMSEDGSLIKVDKSSMEEVEEELSSNVVSDNLFVKEKFFESLKDIFGGDIEIMLN
ncbi:MAG: nucleotidyltransferase domain-containing protein [Candidatus Woesearchaeota archaeon]